MMIIFKNNASLNTPYYRFTRPWHAAALTFITSDTRMIFLMSHYQIWNHWRERDFTITLHWSRTGSVEGCPRTSPRNPAIAEHKAQRINTAFKYRKMCLTGPFQIMHRWKWNTPFTKDLYQHPRKRTCSHLSVVANLQSPAQIISTCLSSSACRAYKDTSNQCSECFQRAWSWKKQVFSQVFSLGGQKRVEINLSTAHNRHMT